ncbi:hypothetical protein [Gilvimarinus sp. 1_MG-2023]|uniref:hypothetical protein n=1 Tax=Gilvimarinus sp. 1_MG-2023 TaxID=3062638 RepID=UPI0026E45382|nr:hypothetical protein [Gilvimarinus sp. 1_MG-2023]MDO6748197.1 hypothetical protein [Gilvimarinus sp. 1_MG-2023]
MINPWLNRYAYAVKSHLPAQVRNDVADELLSDLIDECDYRSETLGRELNDDEVKQLLQERGHPLLVAANFLPRPSLISESLFPLYRQLLQGLVMLIAVVQLSFSAIRAAQAPDPNFWQLLPQLLWSILNTSLYGFAWLTLLFYLFAESIKKANLLQRWQADSLPLVPERGKYISRTGSAIEVVVLIYVTAWVNKTIPQSLGEPSIDLIFSSEWATLLPWITAVLIASLALALSKLITPYWTRPKVYAELALHLPTLMLLFLISQWDNPITLIIGAEENANHWATSSNSFRIALIGYGVYAIVDTVRKWGVLKAFTRG